MLRTLLKRIESGALRKRTVATGQFLADVKVARELANVDEIALCQDIVKCIEISPQHMRLFWAGVVSTINVLMEAELAIIKEAKAMKEIDVYVDERGNPHHLAIPNEQAQHLSAEKQGDAWRTVCNHNPGALIVAGRWSPETKLACKECQYQLDMWKEVEANN